MELLENEQILRGVLTLHREPITVGTAYKTVPAVLFHSQGLCDPEENLARVVSGAFV